MKQHTGKRKKMFARVLTVVLALVLVFSLSASALAAQGSADSNGKSDQEKTNSGKSDEEHGNGSTSKNGAAEKRDYNGINVDKIRLAIESVTDETQKAELTALLDEYLAALDAKTTELTAKGDSSLSELSKAAADARSALKTALDDAGYTLGSILGWQEFKLGYTYGGATLNLETIAERIAALDDGDENKAALLTLLADYQTALDAQAIAGEDADLEALEEAAKAAREALVDALNEAGVVPLWTRDQDLLKIHDPDAQDDTVID